MKASGPTSIERASPPTDQGQLVTDLMDRVFRGSAQKLVMQALAARTSLPRSCPKSAPFWTRSKGKPHERASPVSAQSAGGTSRLGLAALSLARGGNRPPSGRGMRVLRNRSPNARYLAGWVALAAMACAVPLTAWLVMVSPARPRKPSRRPRPHGRLSADTSTKLEPARMHSMQNMAATGTERGRLAAGNGPGYAARRGKSAHGGPRAGSPVSLALRPALPWLVGGWLAGTLLIALWHLGGWWQVGRFHRVGDAGSARRGQTNSFWSAATIRPAGPGEAAGFRRVAVPTLIGWLRPVILVPASVLAGLPPSNWN